MSFTFGRTDIGISSGDPTDSIIGSSFVCPQNGYAKAIQVYIDGTSGRVKAAMYRADLALLAETDEYDSELSGRVRLPFPSPPPVALGARYYLGVWCEPGRGIRFDANFTGSDTVLQVLAYAPPFPPQLIPTQTPGWILSIYCEASTTAPPVKHMLSIDSTPIRGIPFTLQRIV